MYNSLLSSEYEAMLKETSCTFPKYRDRDWTWWKVIERDRDYAKWMAENYENLDDDLREALEWGLDNV